MGKVLKDPLGVARAVKVLEQRLAQQGLTLFTSTDFKALEEVRKSVRRGTICPMFDTRINALDATNGFWMAGRDETGKICALQAFRLDTADGTLADWATRWMTGLYVMRGELIVPEPFRVADDSVTRDISGSMAYHGQLWLDEPYRNKHCSMLFPRLGMILCLLKWHVDAVWGLMTEEVATSGLTIRIGFPHIERRFLRWQLPPSGADKNEVVVYATTAEIEFIALETLTEDPYLDRVTFR